MMKPRAVALAAATVFGLSSAFTLHAVAAPTPAPPASSTPTAQPTEATSPEPTETGPWGWPQATFKGRAVTITNVKPGWKVSVSVGPRGEGPEVASFSATAQPSGSVTIQLTGFPAGTYDIWIDAGDAPANESYYPGIRIGDEPGPTQKPTKKPEPTKQPTKQPTKGGSNGLAKTGV